LQCLIILMSELFLCLVLLINESVNTPSQCFVFMLRVTHVCWKFIYGKSLSGWLRILSLQLENKPGGRDFVFLVHQGTPRTVSAS